jgi:lauroyl/myristoyl acyltransferase
VTGAGARVRLFGATARLPLGPAVLALESGAEVWVLGMQRTGWGRWRAHLERLEAPSVALPRRQRLSLFLEREARAFERIVAAAPAQWWTLLFPIWEPRAATELADLPVAA